MNHIDNATINYRDELVRKGVHFCSLSIPTIYYFIPRFDAIVILSVLTFLAVALDLGRFAIPQVGVFFNKYFAFMMRKHELDTKKKNLNGASYVLISALACVIIFPKVIVVTAFAILIISDSFAALIGRRFGTRKFLSKSLEGTIAFFITAVVVVLVTPKVYYLPIEFVIGFIAAFVGTIVENISFGFADDNLSIPLAIGFTMWGLYLLLLPNVDLILKNVPL